MFSYRAVLKDPETGAIFRLEHAEEDQWRFFRDDEELGLAETPYSNPKLFRDGGTTETLLATGETLVVPEQMFGTSGRIPSIGTRHLELIEWSIGGKKYV